jgi:tetratricopeptide (TPR) repeat protein
MAAVAKLPRLTPEQRRAAAGQFDRANQVLAQKNYDYAIPLLITCCEIDPGNLLYRKVLRQAERDKYENNGRGQLLSFFTTLRTRIRMEAALHRGEYLRVLDLAEQILARNPWSIRAQAAMARAYEELGLEEHALWVLELAIQSSPSNAKLHKKAAELYETRGMFSQAIHHWSIVRKLSPYDKDASGKAKDLAASATIARGKYEQTVQSGGRPLSASEANVEESDETGQHPPKTDPEMPTNLAAATETRSQREIAQLRARIQANPTNPHGYLHLAQFFRRNDRFDEARAVLTEGLGPTGNNFHLTLELLDVDIEPLRRDLAVAEHKLAAAPTDKELQAVRQNLVMEVAKRELAFYRQRSDRFPTDTAARFEMALRLIRVGQVEEAIKELQGLRHDARNLGKILFYLGFCFKTRNHWRLAQRNFEESLQHLAAGDEELRREALYLLATGYAEHGEYQRAVELGCELANLDFSFKNIGASIEQWQSKLQKVK